MNFFGIKERKNETNNGTELALKELMRTKLKILPVDEKKSILTEFTELRHAVHNQIAEVFNRDRL